MNLPKTVLALAILTGLWSAPAAAQSMVQLAGRTREYGTKGYQQLGHIKISVYRTGPVTHGSSDTAGDFNIPIPAGAPFQVLFIGSGNHLPELQSLSAEGSTSHNIHVCLLTPAQAKQQGIDPYRHVKAIIDQLEAHGIRPDDEFLTLLRRILQKLG